MLYINSTVNIWDGVREMTLGKHWEVLRDFKLSYALLASISYYLEENGYLMKYL